jgi:preprotein translocase subunit SecF
MLVGMLVGAYSSVFLAVPLAVDLKLRDPQIKAHTARVLAKRKAEGLIVDADGDPIGRTPEAIAAAAAVAAAAPKRAGRGTPVVPVNPDLKPGAAPLPGARPTRPTQAPKPAGSTPVASSSGAPAAGKTAPRPTGKTGPRPAGKRGR